MNTIFYKVIFKALEEHEDNTFSLTFRSIIDSKPICIPSHYFSTLKELSKKDKNVINFQNIQEVIKIGENGSNYIFNYYIVLLFTQFENREKQGFLIGNAKNYGDILIGIWPFNKEFLNYSSNTILEIFDNLIYEKRIEKVSVIFS
ncbi:MAG: hypothetical protein ACFFKA_05875 [Candidatus Thorarchaeota archaeon]